VTPILELAEFRSAGLIAASTVTRLAASRRAPAPASGDCLPNTTRVAPSGPDLEANDLTADRPNSFGDGKSTSAALARSAGSLEHVERRLDALKEAHRFEAVDNDGAVLFAVAPGAAVHYNEQGQAVGMLRLPGNDISGKPNRSAAEGVMRRRACGRSMLGMLCGWLALAPLVNGAPSTPSADEVLQKSRAAYAALKSYEDKGTVDVEFGQSGSQVRERHAFRTAYKAPRQYLFDFTKANAADRYVAWGDGENFHAWWKSTGQQQDFPQGRGANAFVFGASPTGNAIVQIAPLLFPNAGLSGPVLEFGDAVNAGVETLDGHDCYKLSGFAHAVYKATGRVTDSRAMTVWVDAQTMLVRRVFEDRSQGKLLNRSTTSFEPLANPQLDERTFHFEAPK
jgi:outer membrane lipoprotein-sorting protein